MQNRILEYIGAPPEPRERVSELITLPAGDGLGQRVDRFLAAALPETSRTRIQHWMRLGAVTVDGQTVLPKYRIRGDETIEVMPLPTEAQSAFEPDPMPIEVIFEDEHLAVLNKPAGCVTHPAPGHWRHTLMNGVLARWPDSAGLPRAGIIHRLDRHTSGLLIIARSERAFDTLTALLSERRIERHYLAVAQGHVGSALRIEANIGRDPRDRLRMAVVEAPRGKPAVTHVRPLAHGGEPVASLLECRLETGRTHQIRVHLAARGHPLAGDRLYGGPAQLAGVDLDGRQALHAWHLALPHPVSAVPIVCEIELAPDLKTLVGALGLQEACPQPIARRDPESARGPGAARRRRQ